MQRFLSRFRVFLGFVCAALAFWFAHPSLLSVWWGGVVALLGETIRVWAAGHIDKGREITRSGPYKYVRHPLYLGSTLLGVGFVIAARSWIVAIAVALYLVLTLTAAIRTEEAALDRKFDGAYAAYRAGTATPVARRFSMDRVIANREYRALAGLAIGMILLWMRASGRF